MTLGHDFSERSEREIISKEKAEQISASQRQNEAVQFY